MLFQFSRIVIAAAFCVVAILCHCQAQPAPAVVLEIDVENVVRYYEDTTDLSKLGSVPGITTPTPAANFRTYLLLGDIVAINGQPVRGTVSHTARVTNLRPVPNSGEAIADTNRGGLGQWAFEVLSSDGAPIGTFFLAGMHGGAATPGSPLEITQGNNAIIGGTGAFLGARGDFGQAVSSQTIAVRESSMTEDPSNRRKNGGGRIRWVLHVVPMSRPEVVITPSGPAVTHSSDFTLVTAAKPAVAGETLSLFATGLGPTRPGVNPGQLFPSSPLVAVNSPVEVRMNGKTSKVISAVGFPGAVDGYQVNFQVPPDTPGGLAAVQLSVAWIAGSTVSVAVQ